MGLPNILVSKEGRGPVAARFYGWQAGVENALGARLNGIEGLELRTRMRAKAYQADLAALGVDIEALPICPVPQVRDAGEALGLLYVVEGATLGGKVIGKSLRARGCDLDGLGFLDPYGPRTGAMWRGFLTVLEREARSAAVRDQTVRGAVMGFEQAESWLNRTEVSA